MSSFLHRLGERALGKGSAIRPLPPGLRPVEAREPSAEIALEIDAERPAAVPDPRVAAHERSRSTGATRRQGPVPERETHGEAAAAALKLHPGSIGPVEQVQATQGTGSATAPAPRDTLHVAPADQPVHQPRPDRVRRQDRAPDPVQMDAVRVAASAIEAADIEKWFLPARHRNAPQAQATPRSMTCGEPTRRATEAAAHAPDVHIHIGRIELTALAPPSPPRRDAATSAKKPMSLDEYLRKRNRTTS
jgi:hypothetical protein